jgi:hypothetical protein
VLQDELQEASGTCSVHGNDGLSWEEDLGDREGARKCADAGEDGLRGSVKTVDDDYCLDMARSMATNGEDRGADIGDDGFEWRRRSGGRK